ncbi:cytosolic carboxypeptidase 2-like isoform X1 [Littorina saxatilis]|uniref:cytosolic carboxypeptidase 2-like isoform X1 n=1 Tax=Littorina saxatilis TaxID=31220 RepID=UPI0038B54D31
MWPPGSEDRGSDQDLGLNPYESFMKKHLQHYGYFTGRNQNYRNGFQQYNEWEKNYAFPDGSSSSSDSDSDSDDDKTDNRLQDDLMRTTQLVYSCESGRMVPRLREPRNLYALAKELGPQQAARWPSEIQVERGRVLHQYYVPTEPEPFYKMTGTEKTPMCRGEENGGRVVFEYDPKFSFFMRSRVGGSRNGCSKCSIDLESDNDNTLLFESRFESGNLAKAVKVGDYDYELWLRYDLYTNKHTQWFYFRVNNMKPNTQYRFTIVNLLKPDSLYNFGMRPCMYSDREAMQNKVGWTRAAQNIKYYRNNLKYETSKGDRSFYSLTWTMQFPHDNDTVYLAHCYPYTYSDLQDYLLELQNDPIKSRICKQRVLCRTLAGNMVYVLTITSAAQNPEDMKHKKAVVVTSRVHPGESNSSWMMKGFLDYLTGSSADAKLLRDTFIFKIVPMLNPDGVIVGNYRCSLAGRDLNRNYKTVLKDSYPSVWHTKNMIRKLVQERDIIVYCDLHGHSRRQNVFIYGCENKLNTNKRLHERVFPCMLNKNAPDRFSYDACKFKVQKSKEGTGRIVMWNMGIMNSYTMEATFCGSTMGKKKGFHFSVADYESLGYHFCDTLLDYCDPDNSKYVNLMGDLENRMKMEIMARFGRATATPGDINLSDYASEMETSDGGSDSSVSDGPPLHLQYTLERPLKKKKKLKTRKDRDRVRQVRSEEPRKPNVGMQTEEKQSRGAVEAAASSKPDKVGVLPFRYSSNSGKRPRSNDDRSNNGIPIFVQERCEERQQKRQDYLDALTSAYLRNGVPLNKETGVFVRTDPRKGSVTSKAVNSTVPEMQSVVHFRYSERTGGPGPNLPVSMEGLCAHHGQTLAAQLAGAASPRGQGRGYPPSSHPAPVVDTQMTPPTSVDEFVRSQITPSHSISPLDRRPPSRPHLLEVSAAQQRQQDTLRESSSARTTRSHLSAIDNKGSHSGKAHLRTRVPSATAINYRAGGMAGTATQPISLLGQGSMDGHAGSDRGHPHHDRDHNHDGRKSRKGMREGEEEDMETAPAPRAMVDLGQAPSHRPPRIKSVHAPQEIVDAMDSIRQLQNSMKTSERPKTNLTSAAGTYIKQLIKETSDEIEDLTNEIDDEIEHKLQEVRDLQHHQGPAPLHDGAAASSMTQLPLSSSQAPRGSTAILSGGAMIDFQQQTTARSLYSDRPPSSHKASLAIAMEASNGNSSEGAASTRQPTEDRKRMGSAYSGSGREEYVQVTNAEGGSEMAPRARSARSGRQVVEAVPTKISLMICSDHREKGDNSKQQFLPRYRSVRAPFFHNRTQSRRK